MKTIPAGFATHITGDEITTAICWTLTKKNSLGVVRGTEHDRDVTITTGPRAGVYYAYKNISGSDVRTTSDLNVDNLEVVGAIEDTSDDGITWEEIEAGVIDFQRVTIFTTNWQDPDAGQVILRTGFTGHVQRDSDGKLQLEIRGLGQILSQVIGRILSDRCDVVRFGDTRCGFNLASITGQGAITAVASRKEFTFVYDVAPPLTMLPPGGEIEFLSGENSGFEKEVKSVALVGVGTLTITLFEEMVGEVQVGDVVEYRPGCDRTFSTCRLYDNVVNFRGHGVFVPGALAVMRGAAPGGDCDNTVPPPESPWLLP